MELKFKNIIYKPKLFISNIFSFIRDWSNTISAIAMAISVIFIIKNQRLVIKSIENSNKQLKIQQEQLEMQKKSLPAEFEFSYKNINKPTEQAFIKNIGTTDLKNIETVWYIYFIDNNDNIILASNLSKLCKKDTTLLNRIRYNKIFPNIINNPIDFEGMFGTNRKFNIKYLSSYNNDDKNNVTSLDISSTAMQNAIKINKILNTEMFIMWKIKYNEELSYKKKITYKYIWIVTNNLDTTKIDNKSLRLDLRNVIGGERIISLIKEYSENTKEIIFK